MSASVCLVCGDDDFLIDLQAKAVVDELVPQEDRAGGLEIIDGRVDSADAVADVVRRCLESVQTDSFFSRAKLTWLRDAAFLAGGTRASDSDKAKDAVGRLVQLVRDGLPDGHHLLVTATDLPRNSAVFKAFGKAGKVHDTGSKAKPWELAGQAAARVQELLPGLELTMAEDVCAEFVERVGFDMRMLVRELEKLRAYVGRPGAVQAQDVRTIATLSHAAGANDLTAAVGDRNVRETVSILRRLLDQGESGIKLATMVENRVRDLLVMREAMDRQWLSVSESGRLPRADWRSDLPPEADALLAVLDPDPRTRTPWQLGRPALQARNYTLNELRLARHLLIELREKLVSSSLPEAFLVETALLKIVTRPPRPAAAPHAAARGRK